MKMRNQLKFLVENRKGRDHLVCESVDWIQLARDSAHWQPVVKMGSINSRNVFDQLNNYHLFKQDSILLVIVRMFLPPGLDFGTSSL
jgi:hypothetical protein